MNQERSDAFSTDNLVWIDLEMTGLDPQTDRIIEIATVVTDAQLETLAEGPVIAISVPESVLDGMDEWNQTHHGQSGLLDRVRQSRFDLEQAAQLVPAGASPMCGNSICQDRRFLAREMPRLEAFFHYRNLDVSTLKELARRWAPAIAAGFRKQAAHLALDDIRESIGELRHYREHLLRV